jgi:hypothetical protein
MNSTYTPPVLFSQKSYLRRNAVLKGMMLLFLMLTTQAFGQTFSIVGNGTASNTSLGYPAPFGNYYWGARHQFFVTAAQLTASGIPANATISSLGFNVTATNGAAAHAGYQIRVYTTSSTNPIALGYLTTGLVAQTTAASVTPVLGWNQSAFSSSFVWNGSSNLVVEVCFNNTGFANNASTQWTTTGLGTGTWSRWFRSDASGVCANTGTTSTSTTTRPNMRFGWTIPPSCTTLSTPSNGSTNLCFNGQGQTLNWSAATGTVTGYRVFFGTNNPPTSIQNGTNVGNVLNWTTGVLSANTTYYWRIVPTGPSGDASGCNTVFSFTTRGIACAPPGCATYTAPANGATNQNANGIALTWTAPGSGDPPTGYKVYFGTNNPPTNLVNGTNIGNLLTWQTPALSGLTTYYWQIVPTNGTGDATGCGVRSFTTGSVYCASNATVTADTKINSVSMGTINASTGATVCETYTNNTHLSTQVQQGGTASITIGNGSCSLTHYTAYCGVYIDWNQNMLFTDPGELVYSFGPTSSLTNNTGTISVPSNATVGNTRMRIVLSEGGAIPSPCGTYSYGETEDYTIVVVTPPAPSCATLSTPANASTNLCFNGNGQSLNWSAATGSVSGYKVFFGTNNPPTNIQNGTNVGNVLNWTTGVLSASTTYYWRVVPTGPGGDASGCNTVYSFTTAASICAPPGCASYTAPTNALTGVNVNGTALTWTAPTTGGLATGYKVYFGTNNPPTNLVNGTNIGNVLTWNTPSLNPLTTYYWQIVPTNGTGDATGCAVFSFTSSNIYCNTSYATITGDTKINSVTMGTINASTGATVCETYTNNTHLSTSVLKGASVSISIGNGSCSLTHFTAYCGVYIDWNQDLDFLDAGELVYSFGPTSSLTTWNGSFVVPTTAATGSTRMRVVLTEGSSVPPSCGTYSYGETEDYTVIVTNPPAPSCATLSTPANGASSLCYNGNGQSLNWTAATGSVSGYKVYFGTNNPPTNIQNGTNVGNNLNWTTGILSASTTYYWRIVPTGPGGDASSCNTVFSFTTRGIACAPPGCATYTSPANGATNQSANGIALTWTAPGSGDPPTGYKVYFGTNNPPTNLVNGTNIGNLLTWQTPALSALTTYYWQIVPTNGTGDATGCGVQSFTSGNVYCTSNATITADTKINSVSMGTINASTGATVCETYTNNTHLSTQLQQGGTASITIGNGSCSLTHFTAYCGVYIDWNQNMLFTDPGELVYSFGPTSSLTNNTGTITVPSNAPLGNTRMRIVLSEGGAIPPPCGTYSYGETEDYTVVVVTPPAPGCAAQSLPANGATNVCLNAGLNYSWTAPTTGGPVSGYKFYLGTDNPPTNLVNGTNAGNVLIYSPGQTLSASTTYFWRVVATGPGGDAVSCSIRSFTTGASACPVPNCLASYLSPANGATGINSLSGIQLSWTVPSGPTPTGYKVYLGTNNPPTNLANGQDVGNNLNTWFTAPQANTTYYWRVVPYALGGDAVSCNTVYSFATGSGYCIPTYTTGTGSGDYLGQVSIGSLNNITSGAGFPYYTYYNSLAVPTLQQGTSQSLVVSPGTFTSGNVIAGWIDYNRNGVFESGEKLGEVTINGAYPMTGTIAFTVPSCAGTGFTRMRVREVYSNTNLDPCSAYTFGETEDYIVDVTPTNVVPNCATLSTPNNGTTGISLSGTNVTWSAPIGGGCPTGYRLFFGTNNPPTNIVNGSQLGDVVTAATGTLNPSTTYYWRIVPYNSGGDALNCTTVNAFTTCDLPVAPVVSAGSAMQCNQFTANWASSTLASGYFLDVASDNAFANILTGYNNLNVGNNTSAIVSGLNIGTNYYYRVRGYNACGTGTSNSFTTVMTTPIPAVPSISPGTSPVCQGFTANWSSVTHATAYMLTVASDNGFSNIVSGYNGLNVGNVTSYNVSGLNPNTTYYYRVEAANACGNSAASATGSGNTAPLPGGITLNAGSNSQCTSFDISWNSTTNATAYLIDVATDNGFTSILSGYNGLNLGNVTSTTVSGLTAGNTYFVRVRGLNTCGNGVNSNTNSGSTLPVAGVPVVGSASAVSCMNFDANWSSSSNVTQYRLDVSTNSGFSSFVAGFNNLNVGNVTSYTVTGLTGGTQYYYRVKGENTCTTSAPSSSASQVTMNLQDSIQVISNTPVCENGALNLSAVGFTGITYSWNGPSAFTSTLAMPTIANIQTINQGVYSLTASYSGCLDASYTHAVLVNQPIVSVTRSANTPLCSGENLNLTSSGGHYNSIYSWVGPNGFTASTANASYGSIPVLGAGVYTISITSLGCNTLSDTLSVTVIPSQPVTVSSNSPVCQGDALYFSVTSVLGSPYTWNGPNGFSTLIQNPSISNATPNNSGVYTVTLQQPGCNPQHYFTTVNVSSHTNTYTLSSNSPVCTGGTLSITATHILGAIYLWSGPNGFTSNNRIVSIPSSTIAASGQYSVLVTNQGCSNQVRTINAIVHPPLVFSATSNSPVCQGGALYLSASNHSLATYQWSGPNNWVSSLANPALSNVALNAAGVYTVTVNQPGCGTATQTVSVSIGPRINNTSIISNAPVCTASQLNLSATNIAGVSYAWTGPNGFTSSAAEPNISNASTLNSGVYSVSLSSSGCGNIQLTHGVVVYPSVVMAATSNSPVCQGALLNLNASQLQDATYQWIGPAGFQSSSRVPVITNAQVANSGVYTVVSTQPSCGTQTATVTVVVGPAVHNAQIGSNGPLCTGGTLNLTATQFTGATYAWSGPNGFTSSLSTPNALGPVSTLEAGSYSLTLSSPGCSGNTIATTVIVHPPLSVIASANSPICQGSVLYLSSSFHSGATYSWAGPNGFASTGSFTSINMVSSVHQGVYTVTVVQPGCGTQVQTVSVMVGTNPANILSGTNSPVCTGNTLFLSATSLSGIGYGWSGPNGFTSSASSPSLPNVTNAEAGMYTLNLSSPGCSPLTYQYPVVVSTPAVLSVGALNNPICEGSVLALTSNSISRASYLWTGPNGFSSSLENPVISNANPSHTGEYSLSLSQPGCGNYSSTVSATVGANLAGINGGSNSPVCVGGTLNLTSVNRAGVTYLWTGPGGFTSSLSSVSFLNITTAVAGNYTLLASSPGCGSISYAVKVTVNNPVGMSASSNTPVCAGGVLQLQATGATRATYSWTGPNSFASIQQAPSISNAQTLAAGVYSVLINDPTCGILLYTTAVQVGANLNGVNVSSNTPVCVNGSLSLSATLLTGATYAWSGPNGFTASGNNPTRGSITALDAGIYSVTISTAGCNQLTRTTTVLVNPVLSVNPGSNSPVCQGSVVYMTSNFLTGATYLWEGPNGFSSSLSNPSLVNAQPISTGVYTLTINSSSCGIVSGTTSIAIGGNISSVSLSSNGPVCVGNQLNLFSTLVSSGTITWTAPDGFTSSAQNPTRPGILSNGGGVYTYTANSPGCGSITRTLSVLVNPSPVLNAGSNSPVCQGSAIFLTVNTISGATYSWTGPNSYAVSGQNPSISNAQPIRSGVYTLSVTNSSCGTTTTTTTVAVNSSLGSLSATSNTPVCTGNTLNLNITNRTGFTFVWTGPNGFTSTNASPTRAAVTGADAGRYSVVVSSAGCGSMTVQTNPVLVNNPASVTASGTSPVCVGAVIFFSGVAPTGSTYSWSGPAGFVSTIQNPSRSNSQLLHAGVYTLNATVPGCGVVSATTTVNVNSCRETQTTDVKDLTGGELNQQTEDSQVGGVKAETAQGLNAQAKLSAWPNPNSGDVVVLKWEGLTGEDRTITVRIFDATGREVLLKSVNYDLSGMAVEELAFPVRLSKGLYTIETVHDERFVYTKLIIE